MGKGASNPVERFRNHLIHYLIHLGKSEKRKEREKHRETRRVTKQQKGTSTVMMNRDPSKLIFEIQKLQILGIPLACFLIDR